MTGKRITVSSIDRDRYGGWRKIRFDATGFFRLERSDRWWFVTPEGNAFLSWGLNHVHPQFILQDYNIETWKNLLSVTDVRDNHFARAFRDRVMSDLTAFGMNTLGPHSPIGFHTAPPCPYVEPLRFVKIDHWALPQDEDFYDVFSPEFESHCDRLAERIAAPRKDDPLLIGYVMTDCPIYTEQDAVAHGNNIYGRERHALPTWPRVLRNRDADSPGKRAYVDLMRDTYQGDIKAFNTTYGTRFPSFDALAGATCWRREIDSANENELRDNRALLLNVIDRYYTVAVKAIKKHDPNHMVFGDIVNGNTDPQDDIIALIGKHMALLAYQFYGYFLEQQPWLNRWSRITGKPLFNADSACAVPHDRMPDPFGPHCSSQEEQAERFREFAHNAFARADFIGWNWCGWVDLWESSYPGKQHSGIQDAFGNHYVLLRRAMAEFAGRMYQIAAKGRTGATLI